MTKALCITCGELKFGAMCPCPACMTASTGNTGLDIAFSDHYFAVDTLNDFGNVIRTIAGATEDPTVRFWSFLKYISTHHSYILSAEPDPHLREEVERVLNSIVLPHVTVKEKFGVKVWKLRSWWRKRFG